MDSPSPTSGLISPLDIVKFENFVKKNSCKFNYREQKNIVIHWW